MEKFLLIKFLKKKKTLPISDYGKTKLLAEKELLKLKNNFNIHIKNFFYLWGRS